MTEYLPELEEWGIKITCPDCGELFELTQHGNCYCKRCKRILQKQRYEGGAVFNV